MPIILLGFLFLGDFCTNSPELSKKRSEQRTMESNDVRPILVIVPHPDDEAFGFSGTLGAAKASGAPVRVFLLSDGECANIAEQWIQEQEQGDLTSAGMQGDLNNDGVVDQYDFGAARRNEFKDSMKVLGISKEDIVFLGNAYGDSPLDPFLSTAALAEYIYRDSEQAGFPLGGSTRIFTVAPQLGDGNQAIFYGDTYDKQMPQLHNIAASAAQLLSTDKSEISPSNVYLFKVYAHSKRGSLPQAPIIFVPSGEDGGNMRRQVIKQYSNLGKQNAPHIYQGALRSKYEYAATLQQILDAGLKF